MSEDRLTSGVGERVDLRGEIDSMTHQLDRASADRSARTLLNDPVGLRVVLVVLKSGARLERHSAPGRLTIHALDGQVQVSVEEAVQVLDAGQLLTVDAGQVHEVTATIPSALLLTIAGTAATG